MDTTLGEIWYQIFNYFGQFTIGELLLSGLLLFFLFMVVAFVIDAYDRI